MSVDWHEGRNVVGRKFGVFSALVVLSHRCFVVAADPGVMSGWSSCWLWAHSATPGQSANTHRSMGNGGEFEVLLLQMNGKKHMSLSNEQWKCNLFYFFFYAHVMLFQVGAANMEVSLSEFVDLVKNLLKNPEEREHFFQVSATVAPWKCVLCVSPSDPEQYEKANCCKSPAQKMHLNTPLRLQLTSDCRPALSGLQDTMNDCIKEAKLVIPKFYLSSFILFQVSMVVIFQHNFPTVYKCRCDRCVKFSKFPIKFDFQF